MPSFEIKNDGYLQLTDVSAMYVVRNAQGPGIGTIRNVSAYVEGNGPEKVLSPTQTITSKPGINFSVPVSAVKEIDVGVIIYFRPWPLTFLKSHKIYRFVGHPTGATLTWYKQPPGDLDNGAWDNINK